MSTRMRAPIVFVLLLACVAGACGGEALPEGLRQGRSVYSGTCSPCHGSSGQGQVGPALDAVIETWPSCEDHIEWIALGSDRWRETHGDVYGATEKPIKGGMPEHASKLSADELAAVAAFERAQYGGSDPTTALSECGVS